MKTSLKRIMLIALSLCLIMTSLCFGVSASDEFEDKEFKDGDFTYYVYDGKVTLTKYSGKEKTLTYPLYVGGYPVKCPGFNTLYKNKYVKSVVLPKGYTHIDGQCFQNLTKVKSFTIPSTVKKISMAAFYECTGLKSIVLPYGLESIGYVAFCGCSNLKSISFTTDVEFISEFAFDGCESLTDVYYTGTKAQWKKIDISRGNENLLNAKIHYKSHIHKYKEKVTKEPTYTKTGKSTFTCSCGDSYKETTPMLTLPVVKNLKVTSAGTDNIKVSWDKVKSAKKYKISYSTNGTKWESITTTKNSAKLTGLTSMKTYYIKVQAVSGSNEGYSSKVVSAFTLPPKASIGSLESAKAGQLKVNWTSISRVSGYEIHYSTTSDFSKDTAKVSAGSKKTAATIKKLTSGKTYFVKIRAYKKVDEKKIYGAFSATKKLAVK